MRRFEFADGKSNKFWEIEQHGLDLNLRWGRIGTQGQGQVKTFADDAKCAAAMAKLVVEKTAKGYVEIGAEAVAAVVAPPVRVPPPAPVPVIAADPLTAPPWLAQGEPLAISKEMAAAALASRRAPKPVPPVDPKDVLRRLHGAVDIMTEKCDAEVLPACEEAARRLEEQSLDGSLMSDAVLLAVSNYPLSRSGKEDEYPFGELMLDAIAACKGLEYCVEVFLEMLKLQAGLYLSRMTGKRIAVIECRGLVQLVLHEPFSGAEIALRRQLSSAPEEVWQACADKIERALPATPPLRRAALAAQLPERPELSNRLVHELIGTPAHATLPLLLLSADEPELLRVLGEKMPDFGRYFGSPMLAASILADKGVQACTPFSVAVTRDTVSEALTQVGTPDAIKLLVESIARTMEPGYEGWGTAVDRKTALARLAAALQRWPLAGIAGLAEVGERPGKVGAVVGSSLAALVNVHADCIALVLPWVSPAAQALLQRLLRQANTSLAEAAREDLPPVLANPPWMRPRKKAAAPLDLQPLLLAPVERWDDVDRDQWAQAGPWWEQAFERARQDPAVWVAELGFRRNMGSSSDEARKQAIVAIQNADSKALVAAWRLYVLSDAWSRLHTPLIPLLPGDMGVETWNLLSNSVDASPRCLEFLLARFGLRALPGMEAMLRNRFDEVVQFAPRFGSVAMAAPMARAAVKLKKLQDQGRQWLLRFPEHAVCGLIAPALGKAGEEKACAVSALRYLRANGHEGLILEVAARYDNGAVTAAVRALLDEDPLERLPAKVPKLPDFWAPLGWRRLVLNERCGAGAGKAVPSDVLHHIGTMLVLPTVDGVYPGVAQLRDACTPESLADFSWDCFMAWLNAGGSPKDGWALSALGWLGTDDTARKLMPFIKSWPPEGAHARAVAALDVLADIGSEVALMLLNGVAQKAKQKPLQDKAREKIARVAEARGLTAEELEDRMAPDLGLEPNGTLLLDFGPRRFLAGFDEALKPFVRDEDGKRLPDLPKPRQSDDEALATAAVERFKALKKDARSIASQQVARLEWAMCSRRRWRHEHFRQFLAEHPLLRHLVQRLVWGVYAVGDGGARLLDCFRVAEDGSYATADDDSFTLPEGEQLRVGLPHPLELPPQATEKFGQLFTDYKLLQPFAQLGRDTYALKAGELAQAQLARWQGLAVASTRVLGLASKGWRRGESIGGGMISSFQKPVDGSRMIELVFEPGIYAGMVSEYPEQSLGAVTVGTLTSWGGIQPGASLSTLDPIAASELIRDIESLRA